MQCAWQWWRMSSNWQKIEQSLEICFLLEEKTKTLYVTWCTIRFVLCLWSLRFWLLCDRSRVVRSELHELPYRIRRTNSVRRRRAPHCVVGLALPCYLQWQRRRRRWYSSDLSSVLKIERLLRNSGSQELQQMPPTTTTNTTTLIIICGGSCLWLDSKFPAETARIMASVAQVQWFQIESTAERRIP